MFQKIIDFFKSLFGGGSSSTLSSTRNRPNVDKLPDTNPDLPEADVTIPQDGSEIRPDTAVVVVNETEPVILTEEETDAGFGDDVEASIDPTASTGTGTQPDDFDSAGGSSTSTTEPPTTSEAPATPTEVGAAQPKHKARYLWCLDNGHGKKTAGKRSPKLEDGRQLLEYEFNRDIVKRIIEALDEKGVKYFNVVPEVDTDNFLEGRVARANKKESDLPKLFVSVHANAAPALPGKWSNPSISGIETWFFHNNKRGRKLASVFQKYLIEKTGWKNRHVKSRPNKQFYVLRNTSMTAVLTENGFYNNKAECKELLKDEVRQKIADAHVEAIMEVEKKGL
ncbi:MAG: N-acetylmuramoyl-L-alanine amidase [Bacteroidota bacterium]